MRKLLLLMLFIVPSIFLWAQDKTVTGKVTNEKGEPVASATVKEVGGKMAVQSDENGNFAIKVKAGAKITISYNEYTPSTFTPTEGFNSVVLKGSSVQKLEDVVVNTALGIKKQKKELGYATTQVSAAELVKGKSTNVANALAGKVAGLTITSPNSGVGNDVRVVLRGNRSLLGNNQPILVLDGAVVPIGYMNSLNPNDIESINVLKGAGATAVYGNEASNGALIITTKRGSKGKAVINVSSSVNVEQVSFMPKMQNSFGSNGGEAVDANGNPVYIWYENQSFGPKFDGHMVRLGLPYRIFNSDGTYHDSTLMVPYSGRPDEKKNFFKDALTFQNDVSFSTVDNSGGSFFVSLQDMRKNGTIPNDVARRNSIRLNASKEINKFTVGFNVNYTRSSTDEVWESERKEPIYMSILQTPSHVPLTNFQDVDNNIFADVNGYFNAYYGNPYWAIKNSRAKDKTDDILGNVNFVYKPLKWLTAEYKVSYAGSTSNYEYFTNSVHYAPWLADIAADPANDPWGGAQGTKFSGGKVANEGYRGVASSSRLQGDFLLKATHDFNSDFGATLLLGGMANEIQNKTNDLGYDHTALSDGSANINSYDEVGVWGPNYAIGQPLSYHNESMRRNTAIFADLSLKYKGYLFVHGSIRKDSDSRLEANKRSFDYPAADVSFLFSEAIPAVKNWAPLNSGKLRVSTSKTGNVSIGAYQTRDIFTSATNLGFPFTDATGNSINGYTVGNTFYNRNLGPEFTYEKEVGLELVWLKNRLNTDFSMYWTTTTNQTLSANISAATGRPTALSNVGETQNNGYEISIKGVIIQKKRMTWNLTVNYAHNENKVNSISPDIQSLALNTSGTRGLGGGIYAITGSLYPLLQTTDWVRDPAGHIIVNAKTGVPTKSSTVKPFGTTVAPDVLGINSSFSYDRFTLSVVAEYRHGAVMLNGLGPDMDFSGISENSVKYNRQSFVIPNSVVNVGTASAPNYVTNTNVVNMGSGATTNDIGFFANLYNTVGSNYVTSADFWKLREVSIAYELPLKTLTKTKFIKAATVSIFGRDLLMILPKENMWSDPEFSNTSGNGSGITNVGQTPTTRKFGVGVNLTF